MTDAERVQMIKDTDTEYLSTYIPDYWQVHLEEKIARIHTLQVQAGISGTSFGLVTDFHCGDNCMHSAALMEKVLTECGIPYFFNAGKLPGGNSGQRPCGGRTLSGLWFHSSSRACAYAGGSDPGDSGDPSAVFPDRGQGVNGAWQS